MRYTEAHRRLREIHWFDHADSYLAVVRDALQEDPHDKELRELMAAMENAIAAQRRQPLH
jgi:predicted alpha/beta hydrolase family esterase